VKGHRHSGLLISPVRIAEEAYRELIAYLAGADRQDLPVASGQAKEDGKAIAAWRDDFLAGGKEGLKGQRGLSEEDQRLREAERKIGELTMEVEVWRRAAEKRGAAMPPAKRPR
jgi:hypothetical protein